MTPPPLTLPADHPVQAELARIAALEGGTVGLAARRLSGGPLLLLNPGVTFPMASVFKIPIAVEVLRRADRGELRLTDLVPLEPRDFVSSAVIEESFPDRAGVSLSCLNLLEVMLTLSDNTATDCLYRLCGGAPAFSALFHDLGVGGVRIDRDTAGIILDYFGAPRPGPGQTFLDMAGQLGTREEVDTGGGQSNPAFEDAPEDTATPEGMLDLLVKVRSGGVLSPGSLATLLAILRRCRTGTGRIPGMLPPGLTVGRKTGTIGGVANDAGYVELPDGSDTIVLVIFTKLSDRPLELRERTIAQLARTAYDYLALAA